MPPPPVGPLPPGLPRHRLGTGRDRRGDGRGRRPVLHGRPVAPGNGPRPGLVHSTCRGLYHNDALSASGDLKSVMERMGHAQIQTTQKYLHAPPKPTRRTSTPSPAPAAGDSSPTEEPTAPVNQPRRPGSLDPKDEAPIQEILPALGLERCCQVSLDSRGGVANVGSGLRNAPSCHWSDPRGGDEHAHGQEPERLRIAADMVGQERARPRRQGRGAHRPAAEHPVARTVGRGPQRSETAVAWTRVNMPRAIPPAKETTATRPTVNGSRRTQPWIRPRAPG